MELFSPNCYSIIGMGELAGAYFKHWRLQYIVELSLKDRQHVKIRDVSSVFSAPLSRVGKGNSVRPLCIRGWELLTPPYYEQPQKHRDWLAKDCWGRKALGTTRENWEAGRKLAFNLTPPGLAFPLDTYLAFTQTLGRGGITLALQIQKLRLREATHLGSDQDGACTQAHVSSLPRKHAECLCNGHRSWAAVPSAYTPWASYLTFLYLSFSI